MIKIGYLHLGNSQTAESGITRFGHQLASAAKTLPNVEVKEIKVIITKEPSKNLRLLREGVKQLIDTDILHFNYSQYLWGIGWKQLYYLAILLSQYTKPIIVTLHDVFPSLYPQKNVKWVNYFKYNLPMIILAKIAKFIVVNNQQEMLTIKHLISSEKIQKIPIYVEERNIKMSSSQARELLGLQDYKIITLQGFIYKNKGHQLLIKALPYLDKDVKVIFAGTFAPDNEALYQSLLKQSQAKNVADQLIITGYLSDAELEQYLVATHLAVCPFQNMSASASISTWISVGRPILASNLPQIEEYNHIEPDAIYTFESKNVSALVEAIKRILPYCNDQPDSRVVKLREKLLLPKIIQQYMSLYEKMVND